MREQLLFTILLIGVLCFILSIPFGMIRTRFKKFSVLWFLTIHAPIPVSAVLRRLNDLSFWYIPIFVVFCVGGQILGGKLIKKIEAKKNNPTA